MGVLDVRWNMPAASTLLQHLQSLAVKDGDLVKVAKHSTTQTVCSLPAVNRLRSLTSTLEQPVLGWFSFRPNTRLHLSMREQACCCSVPSCCVACYIAHLTTVRFQTSIAAGHRGAYTSCSMPRP